MYGTGARLLESHQLRIKDLDFDLLQIAIRDGKRAKDRGVMLPDRLHLALRRQVSRVEELHDADRRRGGGWAQLPGALDRKDPRAGYDARSVQKLMGHNDIRTTMDYVHSITDAGLGMRSPLDRREDDAED